MYILEIHLKKHTLLSRHANHYNFILYMYIFIFNSLCIFHWGSITKEY